MKTIILVRHANAAARRRHFTDLERELTPGGERKAKRTAVSLKRRGIEPSLLISSPAHRAMETAQIAAGVFNYPLDRIVMNPVVYEPRDAGALFTTVREIGDENDTVMLVGHNPSLEDFAANLVDGFEGSLQKAGMIQISIDKARWSDVLPGDGRHEASGVSPAVRVGRLSPKQVRTEARAKIASAIAEIVESIHAGSGKKMKRDIGRTAGVMAKQLAKIVRAAKTI